MVTNLDVEATTSGNVVPPASTLGRAIMLEPGDVTTRKWISYILIALLAALLVAAFADLFLVNATYPAPLPKVSPAEAANAIGTYNTSVAKDSSDDADRLLRLLNIVFGPMVTLVSSVVGFYFGARTAKEGSVN